MVERKSYGYGQKKKTFDSSRCTQCGGELDGPVTIEKGKQIGVKFKLEGKFCSRDCVDDWEDEQGGR